MLRATGRTSLGDGDSVMSRVPPQSTRHTALAYGETHQQHLHIHSLGNETGFPGGSGGKESAVSARDLGSIPSLARSPGEGNGYPLQYSCLGNPTDGRAWRATVHGVQRVGYD